MDYQSLSEPDVAYQILSQNDKQSIYYKDLILDVIEKKHKPVQSLAAAISEIYTMINMDSRFYYAGEGRWGLSEWIPPDVKRGHGKAKNLRLADDEMEDEE